VFPGPDCVVEHLEQTSSGSARRAR
jgi:hypothetical protein